MANTPESKIKKEIVAYLDSLAPDLYHFPVHNVGYGRKGVPDRICCYKGFFFGLEVKAAGKSATPWQRRELCAIIDAGGVAEVVFAVEDVMGVIRVLEERTRLRYEDWK